MRHLFILVFCLFSTFTYSAIYTFQTDGDWNDASNWDTYPGTTTNVDDQVIIDAAVTVNVAIETDGTIQINSGAVFIVDIPIKLNGPLVNEGILNNESQIILDGPGENLGVWNNNGPLLNLVGVIFSSYGTFNNNSSITAYNGGIINIYGSFTNTEDGHLTTVVELNITNSGSDVFLNGGYLSISGNARIEGKLINAAGKSFYINSSANVTFSNNAVFENYGNFYHNGLSHMSNDMISSSILGYCKINKWGYMIVEEDIPSIL